MPQVGEPLTLLRAELRPAGSFRLGGWRGLDGLLRRRGNVLERLLHHAGRPVVVAVAQPQPTRVLMTASAFDEDGAAYGIERMRFALGVDEDHSEFRKLFARDPLIGQSLRARPWLRLARRPEPFEALAWAICEQLIEYERAAAIERRLVRRVGRRCPRTQLCDLPEPSVLAGVAPAMLQSLDLAGARAVTLVRVSREVASGRVDLNSADHERGWRRLRAIPGVGAWTVEQLALYGQGRDDQLPAGDLSLLKLAGRVLSGGDPRARAQEHEVRALFAPYGRWAGLAAAHALAGAARMPVGRPAW